MIISFSPLFFSDPNFWFLTHLTWGTSEVQCRNSKIYSFFFEKCFRSPPLEDILHHLPLILAFRLSIYKWTVSKHQAPINQLFHKLSLPIVNCLWLDPQNDVFMKAKCNLIHQPAYFFEKTKKMKNYLRLSTFKRISSRNQGHIWFTILYTNQ